MEKFREILQICRVIFDITFRQTIRSKKTIFMLIVTFVPMLLAGYYRIFAQGTRLAPGNVLSLVMTFYLQFLSALVALFYATSLVADEIDSKTIIYLFTRPVRRYIIIAGKFAAYMVEVCIILLPPMLFTYLIIAAGNGITSNSLLSIGTFSRQVAVTTLALASYGAIFTFFGAWWKRPVVLGLLFAFGWEKVIFMVPGTVRKFSVIHYLISIFPKGNVMQKFRMQMPPQVLARSSTLVSLITLVAIIAFFLGLAIFTIHRKEYRFE